MTSAPFHVPINDDNILEDDAETFTLTIKCNSLHDQVSHRKGMGKTTVSIVDDGGKYILLWHVAKPIAVATIMNTETNLLCIASQDVS